MIRTSERQRVRALARAQREEELEAAQDAADVREVIRATERVKALAAKKKAAAEATAAPAAAKSRKKEKSKTSTKKQTATKIIKKKQITKAKSKAGRKGHSGRATSGDSSVVEIVDCEVAGIRATIHRATSKDLKEQQKNKKNRSSGISSSNNKLWILTSTKQRHVHYQEAGLCICQKEQSLLPAYGGRSWEVTCRVTEDQSQPTPSKVLFRMYRGRMELACLPHLIDKIPPPPTWPGRAKVEEDEWDMTQHHASQSSYESTNHTSNIAQDTGDDLDYIRQLQERPITNLTTLAWEARSKYPIPVVSVKWKSPDHKSFSSRKAAWEYATKLSEEQVYIQKHLKGIGASGKLLQPFVPSGPESLRAGLLRFQRDGLWVCGQELSWQANRPKELIQLAEQKQKALQQQREEEEREEQEQYEQEQEEQIEQQNEQIQDEKEQQSPRQKQQKTSHYVRKPTGLRVFLEAKRKSYQKEQSESLTLREADTALRKLWKTLSSREQSKYIERANELRSKFVQTDDPSTVQVECTSSSKSINKSQDGGESATAPSTPDSENKVMPSASKVQEMKKPSVQASFCVVPSSQIAPFTATTSVKNDNDYSQESSSKPSPATDRIVSSSNDEDDGDGDDDKHDNEETDDQVIPSVEMSSGSNRIVEYTVATAIPSMVCQTASPKTDSVVNSTKCTSAIEKSATTAAAMPAPVDLGLIYVSKPPAVTSNQSVELPPKKGDNDKKSGLDQVQSLEEQVVSKSAKTKIQKTNKRRSRFCLTSTQIGLLNDVCMEHFEKVIRTVKSRDLIRELQDGFDLLRERGRGRYDMELPIFDQPSPSPFDFFTSLEKAPWMPIVRKILGDHVVLIHKGFFLSLPGAETQVYHQDGLHLTTQYQRPCHAINVFVPLVDLTSRNGPTEFCLGSHILGHDDYDRDFVETPKVPAGTPIIFDYRLGHRGLGNSSMSSRPVAYCTYARTSPPSPSSLSTSVSDGKENSDSSNTTKAMKEFRDSINFSRKRYHKLGDLIEKPLSRAERCKKRKRSLESREEEELRKVLELSKQEQEAISTPEKATAVIDVVEIKASSLPASASS